MFYFKAIPGRWAIKKRPKSFDCGAPQKLSLQVECRSVPITVTSAGGNILRNIVGNKGGLGGGYCKIMCNNSPFFVSRTIFFSKTSTHPKSDPKPPPKHLQTPQKHLKIGRGVR